MRVIFFLFKQKILVAMIPIATLRSGDPITKWQKKKKKNYFFILNFKLKKQVQIVWSQKRRDRA